MDFKTLVKKKFGGDEDEALQVLSYEIISNVPTEERRSGLTDEEIRNLVNNLDKDRLKKLREYFIADYYRRPLNIQNSEYRERLKSNFKEEFESVALGRVVRALDEYQEKISREELDMSLVDIAKAKIRRRTLTYLACMSILAAVAFLAEVEAVKEVFLSLTLIISAVFAIIIGDGVVAYIKAKKALKYGDASPEDEEDPRKA